jgi:hypothetical protein
VVFGISPKKEERQLTDKDLLKLYEIRKQMEKEYKKSAKAKENKKST